MSLKPLSHRIKEGLVKLRNLVLRIGYRTFARPVFFQIDPEKVHSGMMKLGSFLGSNTVTIGINSILFSYANSKLEQNILNIRFANPVGLAAGFDKNAEIVGILSSVGFGHAEIGSVTGEPCAGNPKPRLWRLKKSSALVVNYGLKNDGCNAIAARLKRARSCIPLGVSIAKTNCKETTDKAAGIADIKKAFLALKDKGDYLTINISCPNAFGGQPFTYPSDLDDLLSSLETLPCKKPVFLKLPPDLTARQVDGILRICDKHRISGFVCSNLTKDANNRALKKHLKDELRNQTGGVSGKPVSELSSRQIRYIYKKTRGKYVIIGCGGVFSARDAYEKIKAGASLIQLITGMIYEGPQLISEINQGLVVLLERDGHKSVSQAVGKATLIK